jgi:hypothetical protein
VLIQSNAPLTDQQNAQLPGLGVAIQEYVLDSTYPCGHSLLTLPSPRAILRRLGRRLTWGFKIPPAPRLPVATAFDASIGTLDLGPLTSRTLHNIDTVLHEDAGSNDSAESQDRRCRKY